MKITLKNDFRKFKKGEYFEFTKPITLLVGNNGCGKSTLLQAIRGVYSEPNDVRFLDNDCIDLSKNFEFDGLDIDKLFVYDSVLDDGSIMQNSIDAYSYIQLGGFHIRNFSHGQKGVHYMTKLIMEMTEYRKNNPNTKIGIILDEFDKGFSLKLQLNAGNVLGNILVKLNPEWIICSTHNYFIIDSDKEVIDIENRKTHINGTEYLTTIIK